MATPLITHRKVSGKTQGTDSTRVYGNHWDDTHVVTGLENVPNVDTSLSGNVAFTQTGTGAVARSVQSKLSDVVHALDFGVATDGSDTTTALANAIAATPVAGTLVLPAGQIRVKGSGSAIFNISNPINIVGQGMDAELASGTILSIDPTAPNTRDLFSITGTTNNTRRGFSFKNFNVEALAGAAGRHVFHFDTTAGTTTNLAEILIDSVFMQNVASAGGYSIFLNNGTGTNTNGGVFNFTVQNCYLGGGINTAYTGDSIRVLNNIISTANAAVILNQVAGAGNFLMEGNNVSGQGGGIIVPQSLAPIIAYNEFEQQATNLEANNSIIDLTGSIANILGAKIIGNQVQANTSTGNPTLLRIAAATGTFYDGNRFSTPASYVPVVITASASGTVIGAGNTYSGVSSNFTDSGTATLAVPTIGASEIGGFLSPSPSIGMGYKTGAGGTVTQATSKSTGVALNKTSGAITMNNAALAAGTIVSFVLTDTSIAATDVLILNHISGGTVGSYTLNAQCAAGSATINVRNNTAGSLSEAIVVQFALMKAVNA